MPDPLFRYNGHGHTDVGRTRTSNEDAYFLNNELGLYVVCDGMGGHAAGEIASAEAVENVYNMVKSGIPKLPPLIDPISEDDVRASCRLMESAVQAATYMIFSIGEMDREKSGMGTTLSALLVWGEYVVTAQVGDSRIYRIRENKVEQLTEDHTLINWQLKQGLITQAEAKRSPHKNVITRAVGNRDYVQVDTGVIKVRKNDRFLLCSDGLHGYTRDEDILRIGMTEPSQAVQGFIDVANARGGKDNITAILLELA